MSNRPVMQALQSVGMTLHGLRRQMERANQQTMPSQFERGTQSQPEEARQEVELSNTVTR